MKPTLMIENGWKRFRSENYSYNFRISDGYMEKWGRTIEDDSVFNEFSPELADLEITTICRGPKINSNLKDKEGNPIQINKLCSFCYKSNTPNGKYMSFETFKQILNKFPKIDGEFVLTQVAFGVDSEAKSNPDIWKIFQYCRENTIVPNLTIASIDDETAQNIAKYAGACAVSLYSDKNVCYDTIDLLSNKYGMKQVNIHALLANSTLPRIWELLNDVKIDKRLKNLNAIVFLSLKKRGRGVHEEPISQEEYTKIVQYCLTNNINFGADSCGCKKLLNGLTSTQYKEIIKVVTPCEASCESFYADVEGKYYPCSFMEGVDDWKEGIDMLKINDFDKDLWNHPKTIKFRNRVLECNKTLEGCCHYKI